MNPLDPHMLLAGATITQAMEALNHTGRHLTVFVVDKQRHLLGSVTDGDIRRGLLAGRKVGSPVDEVMNRAPRVLRPGVDASALVKQLKAAGIRLLPELDEAGSVLRLIDLEGVEGLLPMEALIMAGGRGERLRPYTDTVPKSLIHVAGKPIIEHTLALLARFGLRRVSVSVNYMRDRIMDHLGDGTRFSMEIRYVLENRPLGTAGALGLMPTPEQDTLLMMNSDLMTDVALDRMYQRFQESGADLAIATTQHLVDLPYAVMDLEGDRVRSFREKPSVAYPCNAGIYMMRREVLQHVPAGKSYQATQLIQDLLDRGGNVVAFPINGYWIDIGQHRDLERARRAHEGSGSA